MKRGRFKKKKNKALLISCIAVLFLIAVIIIIIIIKQSEFIQKTIYQPESIPSEEKEVQKYLDTEPTSGFVQFVEEEKQEVLGDIGKLQLSIKELHLKLNNFINVEDDKIILMEISSRLTQYQADLQKTDADSALEIVSQYNHDETIYDEFNSVQEKFDLLEYYTQLVESLSALEERLQSEALLTEDETALLNEIEKYRPDIEKANNAFQEMLGQGKLNSAYDAARQYYPSEPLLDEFSFLLLRTELTSSEVQELAKKSGVLLRAIAAISEPKDSTSEFIHTTSSDYLGIDRGETNILYLTTYWTPPPANFLERLPDVDARLASVKNVLETNSGRRISVNFIRDSVTLPIAMSGDAVRNARIVRDAYEFNRSYDVIIFYPSQNRGANFRYGITIDTPAGEERIPFITTSANMGPFVHEMGHVWGSPHDNALVCSQAGRNVTWSETAECNTREYENLYTPMGWSNLGGHYSAAFKRHLGWTTTINPNRGQLYRLRAIDIDSNIHWLPQGLRVPLSADNTYDYLYLEYRRPISLDSSLVGIMREPRTPFNVDPIQHQNQRILYEGGLLIYFANEERLETWLLDRHPRTSERKDAYLYSGESWCNEDLDICIRWHEAEPGFANVYIDNYGALSNYRPVGPDIIGNSDISCDEESIIIRAEMRNVGELSLPEPTTIRMEVFGVKYTATDEEERVMDPELIVNLRDCPRINLNPGEAIDCSVAVSNEPEYAGIQWFMSRVSSRFSTGRAVHRDILTIPLECLPPDPIVFFGPVSLGHSCLPTSNQLIFSGTLRNNGRAMEETSTLKVFGGRGDIVDVSSPILEQIIAPLNVGETILFDVTIPAEEEYEFITSLHAVIESPEDSILSNNEASITLPCQICRTDAGFMVSSEC